MARNNQDRANEIVGILAEVNTTADWSEITDKVADGIINDVTINDADLAAALFSQGVYISGEVVISGITYQTICRRKKGAPH